MTVGFVMLVHNELDRAAQVARHWAESGCPIVIHCDRKVADKSYHRFQAVLDDLDNIRYAPRQLCEWGTWGIVGATLEASEMLLREFKQVSHIFLASGSCLPLRPVPELNEYLSQRPRTDFIESVAIEDVGWTKGGFEMERFTLRSPFSYKRRRSLFEGYVNLQRRLRVSRKIPHKLSPHMGSQWWCLSRTTLAAILLDPRRKEFDTFFKRVWIPDESYFQSLVRIHSPEVESRSLTLSKFDFQGKPHTFYDDHLQLLRRSDCFVARKIWPKAEKLYTRFLSNDPKVTRNAEPNPSKIDRLFTKAVERRTQGRPGLYMQSRFPRRTQPNRQSTQPYSVFQGFSDLFENFEPWMEKATGLRVHGHLYGPDKVEFAGQENYYHGALPNNTALRDHNPNAFLTNLIWNTRGERQCMMFGPNDTQHTWGFMVGDPNAQISVITGAWAIQLYKVGVTSEIVRKEAARLQKIEMRQLEMLRADFGKATIRVWSLADFIENPMEPLQEIIDEMTPPLRRRLTEAPRMADLSDFGRFIQRLKNQGMNLYVAGDFSVDRNALSGRGSNPRRPYLVQK
jgi:hypothetical protein